MNTLRIELPVKRYLKKYLYAVENLPYGSDVDVTRGGHVLTPLQLVFTEKVTLYYNDSDTEHLDDVLPVLLNKSRAGRFQVIITGDRLRWFNSFLHKSFHDYLLQRVLLSRTLAGKSEIEVIYEVINELGIIDDVQFDAVKKAQYRLRKSKNLDLFRVSNCP